MDAPVLVRLVLIIALPHVQYHVVLNVPLIAAQDAHILVLVQILDENMEILNWR